jgi:hypothetical protein
MAIWALLSDDEIIAMSADEKHIYADSLTNRHQREEFATALLRINGLLGKPHGTHSENPLTSRNRRIRNRELYSADLADADWFVGQIPSKEIDRLINKAINAACTQIQAQVFCLSELGVTQHRIADHFGIEQCKVSRILDKARAAIFAEIDTSSIEYHMYKQCSRHYVPPSPPNRPMLPKYLEAARQVIECKPDLSTHIQQDAPNILEIWRNAWGGSDEREIISKKRVTAYKRRERSKKPHITAEK